MRKETRAERWERRREDRARTREVLASLHGFAKLQYLFSYYWGFLVAGAIAAVGIYLIVRCVMLSLTPVQFYCIVTPTGESTCRPWLEQFGTELSQSGHAGLVEMDESITFAQDAGTLPSEQAEVRAYYEAGVADTAICNEDLYQYLLSMGALAEWDTVLTPEQQQMLAAREVRSTPYLIEGRDDLTDVQVEGWYALTVEGTAFAETYDAQNTPLYCCVFANSPHVENVQSFVSYLYR